MYCNSLLSKIIIQVSVSINIIATESISTKRVPWLPKFSNNFCICTCLHAQAQLRDRERCWVDIDVEEDSRDQSLGNGWNAGKLFGNNKKLLA